MSQGGGEIHVAEDLPGERHELLESLVGVAGDPLFALDAERRFLAVTGALVSITGREPETLLGSHADTVVEEGDLGTLDRMIATVAAGGGPVGGEFQIRTADGALKLCELRVEAVAGDEEYTVGRVEDVTGNRRREERIEVLDRVLRHNVRNKMGSVVGHLRAVTGNTEDENAEIALAEAQSLLRLSEKARECHRLLEREPNRSSVASLSTVLEPVVERRREDHPHAEIRLDDADHRPVVADRELVAAGLMELIDNAVEHSDRETPRVTVSVRPAEEWVGVAVADDGPGIPESERKAILSGEEEPLYHASGLGIWFVKWVARLVGGEIDIEDNEPRGTVVTLRLPTATVGDLPGDSEN